MQRIFIYIFILVSTLGTLAACDDGDKFSSDPSYTLSFSADTLSLDTVLTEASTPTYMLKVYNRNKRAVVISSITLASQGESGFGINVDGIRGNSFSDVELHSSDSLIIFVDATLKSNGNYAPTLSNDSIVFITNGVRQQINLNAYGMDCSRLRHLTIEADTTFTSRLPIVIYDSLVVAEGARLTLEQGTRLMFHDKASLIVHGQIIANGTLTNRITLQGDRTDYMLTDLPYNRLPGQWGGVHIYPESYDNSLNYVNIHGGTYGILCDEADTERTKLTLSNSIIEQTTGDALCMTDCRATLTNCLLGNAGGNSVNMLGGNYSFIHCSLVNHYSWNIRDGKALCMANTDYDTDHPLTIEFLNCLIDGSSSDEINGVVSGNDYTDYNYYFSHCFINSIEEENDNIVDVVWGDDAAFVTIDSEKQIYDFRLDSISPAIGIADIEVARLYPIDLNGNSRLSDDAPDAGCYEYIPDVAATRKREHLMRR